MQIVFLYKRLLFESATPVKLSTLICVHFLYPQKCSVQYGPIYTITFILRCQFLAGRILMLQSNEM